MKILIISHMYPSNFDEIRGIFVHQQVKELQRQNCEVKVVSPIPWTPFPIKYFSRKWKGYSEIPQKTDLQGIEVYYPRYLEFPRNMSLASSGERMCSGIQKIVNKIYEGFEFDLIHSHVALPDGSAGMLLAKEYKKPLVVTIHGQDFYKTIFRNKKCKENIGKVINFSTKTIVVSNALRNIGVRNFGVERSKFVVVPNGIDLEESNLKKNSFISKICQGKKIILSIGYLIKRKAHQYVIKSLSKLISKYPNIIYLIGGDGPEEKKLKEQVKKENLEEYVRFFGRVNREKVISLMSSCQVFVLPSWDEAFGVVYLEAMANGKPVIACRGEGPEDFIKNKDTGILVKPKDIDSLIEAIDFLLSNPEKAQEIGNQARKLVFENYTWAKAVQKIIKVYQNILENEK